MMIINGSNISCPKCGWEPDESCRWKCDECGTSWNTFETRGKCPGCGKQFIDTRCSKSKGGCGQTCLNADWYEPIEQIKLQEKKKFVWFWQEKKTLPITEADKKWVENAMLTLSEVFDEEYFKSLPTVTPDKNYFDHEFDGTESDAEFILGRLMSIMRIDASKIKLMFFSSPRPIYSGGLITVNVPKANSLANTAGLYVNDGNGPKEIWVETSGLRNTMALTKTLAHELARYKLLGERRRLIKNDEQLTDLVAIAFGFGIFVGNAPTYLQEPITAYALAWLVHYRSEDPNWKDYLNPTMKKYFEKSYAWISQNKDQVKWSSDA
jgi:hypothetical protein